MNGQTTHTPGPWDIHESEGRIEIHPADDIDGLRVIADLVFGDTLSADECRANARLIAAAPLMKGNLVMNVSLLQELLSDGAFKRLEAGSDRERQAVAMLQAIVERNEAAIARAEGRE